MNNNENMDIRDLVMMELMSLNSKDFVPNKKEDDKEDDILAFLDKKSN